VRAQDELKIRAEIADNRKIREEILELQTKCGRHAPVPLAAGADRVGQGQDLPVVQVQRVPAAARAAGHPLPVHALVPPALPV
jgi:hypothetical protein